MELKIISEIKKELSSCGSKEKARILAGFFKTGAGEYAQGDKFIGVSVPHTRIIARKYLDLPPVLILHLLSSAIHEERLLALLILISQFEKAGDKEKGRIFKLYLQNTRNINNWDLVDLSAPKIAGAFLKDKDRQILYKLAKSSIIWERRIAIVSTFSFIKNQEFKETLNISALLLKDKEDLIHKAVGWMLREVGKRDQGIEEQFLKKYAGQMPRAMLRYSIEKFPEEKRRYYLSIARSLIVKIN